MPHKGRWVLHEGRRELYKGGRELHKKSANEKFPHSLKIGGGRPQLVQKRMDELTGLMSYPR